MFECFGFYFGDGKLMVVCKGSHGGGIESDSEYQKMFRTLKNIIVKP